MLSGVDDVLGGLSVDDAIADVGVYSDKPRYHALFSALRRDEPVRWTAPRQYRPFWTVSKHADISEVQRKPALFLNGPRTQLNTIEAENRIRAATGSHQAQRTIISTDGAEHAALRQITAEWFMPESVRRLEQEIGVIAKHFVDRMAEHDNHCDFATDIAVWYPLRVILHILGMSGDPAVERTILRLSKEMNGALDKETQRSASQGEHLLEVVREIFEYFKPVAAERRRNPQGDLASIISNATLNGKPIDEVSVLNYFLTASIAGHDTTSATSAGGLLALIQNPQEMAKVRANPNVLRMSVNEMVRWTHPVKHFFRTAVRDYELRGQKIKAGDSLLMCYPSACRDEEVFKEPHRFLADRASNPHLAFGIGPHVCLGQFLAKVELTALFKELFSRVEDIELDGEPVESQTLFMGGLKRLPIRYSMVREVVHG
jgi:cytochrome P450